MKRKGAPIACEARVLRDRLNLMTDLELFQLLNISEATGRNRQSAGSLPPHYKCGNRSFYKIEEVEIWLTRHRVHKN